MENSLTWRTVWEPGDAITYWLTIDEVAQAYFNKPLTLKPN